LRKQTTGLVMGTDRPLEESEAELLRLVAVGDERWAKLVAEWDTAKAPLEEQLAEQRKAGEARRGDADAQLREMTRMRAEMKSLSAAAREREEEARKLLAEYEAAAQSTQRSTFVKRIGEIVKNVKKQEGEIQKITADTHSVQKEIKTSQEQLTRAYTLADDTLFKGAKQQPSLKEGYKSLVAIHEAFSEIIAKLEETDRVARSQREIERKLEEIQRRPVDLEKVAGDSDAVRTENDAIESKLQKARS